MSRQHTLSLIFFSLLLTACGSSPNARMYILNAMERGTAATEERANIVVKVGPVSIPDALDQPNIVTRIGSNRLLADEFNRWSGDFQSNIQSTLGENISLLLPTRQVTLSQEIILLAVDFQVLVNIRRFDGQLGGIVTLNADWTVLHKGEEKTVIAQKSILHENTTGIEYQDYVATQSRLLTKLSQEIVDEIKRQLNRP